MDIEEVYQRLMDEIKKVSKYIWERLMFKMYFTVKYVLSLSSTTISHTRD